jgi:hypothetical protein
MTQWRGLVSRKGRRAATPPGGLEGHDLIDVCDRDERTRMTRMAQVPTTTALSSRALGALKR